MSSRRARIGSGVLVGLLTLGLTLGLVEVALRAFFPVTDIPLVAYEPGLGIHLAPNQTGTHVVGATGTISADYHVNAAGWNSLHEYSPDKPEDVLRVAVIGDSYVEAMQVDVEAAFPALVEDSLKADARCDSYADVEVYSFGAAGAPMSQYVAFMRYAEERYHPDVYVVSIVRNDFAASLVRLAFHPYYWRLRPDGQGSFEEIAPDPYVPSRVRRLLVKSALVRFVFGNLALPQRLPALRNLFAPTKRDAEPYWQEPVTNVEPTIEEMVPYIFEQFWQTAHEDGAEVLVVLDADRHAIYDGEPPSAEVAHQQQMVAHAAAETGMAYIDLTGPFSEDFAVHGEPFEFEEDTHWNERGHAVVAQAVYEWIGDNICADEE